MAATGTLFEKASVAAMALRISYFFMKKVTLVKEFGHSGPNLLLKSLTPTAATASDIQLDRRFAFRFDARAPKWDLKVLRIKEIVTFSFFLFFTSGGEFSDVPSENANSPRA